MFLGLVLVPLHHGLARRGRVHDGPVGLRIGAVADRRPVRTRPDRLHRRPRLHASPAPDACPCRSGRSGAAGQSGRCADAPGRRWSFPDPRTPAGRTGLQAGAADAVPGSVVPGPAGPGAPARNSPITPCSSGGRFWFWPAARLLSGWRGFAALGGEEALGGRAAVLALQARNRAADKLVGGCVGNDDFVIGRGPGLADSGSLADSKISTSSRGSGIGLSPCSSTSERPR